MRGTKLRFREKKLNKYKIQKNEDSIDLAEDLKISSLAPIF